MRKYTLLLLSLFFCGLSIGQNITVTVQQNMKQRRAFIDSLFKVPVTTTFRTYSTNQDSIGQLVFRSDSAKLFIRRAAVTINALAIEDTTRALRASINAIPVPNLQGVLVNGNTADRVIRLTNATTVSTGDGLNTYSQSGDAIFQKRLSGAVVSEMRLLSNGNINFSSNSSGTAQLGITSTLSSFNTPVSASKFQSQTGWSDFKATSVYPGIGYNTDATAAPYVKRFADYSSMIQAAPFGMAFYADSLIGSAGNAITWYQTAAINTGGISTPFNMQATGFVATNRFLSVSSPVDTIAFGPRIDANRLDANAGIFAFLTKNTTNLARVRIGAAVNGDEAVRRDQVAGLVATPTLAQVLAAGNTAPVSGMTIGDATASGSFGYMMGRLIGTSQISGSLSILNRGGNIGSVVMSNTTSGITRRIAVTNNTAYPEYTNDDVTFYEILHSGRTPRLPIRTITAGITLATTDYIVNVNNSTNIVINLPAASTVAGMSWVFKKISNNANTITITPSSGTIETAATYVMSVYLGSRIIYSDGTNWWVQ